jgi:hypothetical protein
MDIALVVVVLLLFVVGPVVVVNRDLIFNRSVTRRRAHTEPPLPFLIIPTSPGAAAIEPAGTVRRQAAVTMRAPVDEPTTTTAEAPPERSFDRYDEYDEFDEEERAEASIEPIRAAPTRAAASRTDPDRAEPSRAEPMRVAPLADMRGGLEEADEMDEPSPDATVVFHRPMDEAVQILPGRLHVLSGEAAGKDFRLVSRIGEPPHIVVGRETGPPYRHITLEAPTVSRRHARMDFVDGHWTITNLSKTNPVLVNNRALLNGGTARKLANGDCIELGEVALRFLAS